MSYGKHWCFTLNNYTPDDEFDSLPTELSYLLYGRETSSSGTPHLQGFCSFVKRKRNPSSVFFNGRAHWEICRSIPASIKYCKKDGDWVDFGTAPGGKGKRSDLDAFKEAIRDGLSDINQIREEHSVVYARYPRFCLEYLRQHQPDPEVPDHPLRPWQERLLADLSQEPDSRSIHFVVDEVGGEGKSWFASHYHQLHKEDTFLCLPGKKADMVYALASAGFAPRVIIVDCPRSKQGDFIQYDFLEECKNGRLFNTKYESRMVSFKTPHVLVMMNEQPDREKLSEDRYVVYTL